MGTHPAANTPRAPTVCQARSSCWKGPVRGSERGVGWRGCRLGQGDAVLPETLPSEGRPVLTALSARGPRRTLSAFRSYYKRPLHPRGGADGVAETRGPEHPGDPAETRGYSEGRAGAWCVCLPSWRGRHAGRAGGARAGLREPSPPGGGRAPTCAAAPVPPALPAQDQGEDHQQGDDEAGQGHHQQEPPLLVERGVRLSWGRQAHGHARQTVATCPGESQGGGATVWPPAPG